MSEQTSKYLKNARAAREENNAEDAKKFYDMVRIDDPENGEAKFFYQYYSLYEGKNGEIPTRFKNLIVNLKTALRCVAESTDSDAEKLSVISAIATAFIPMTWSLNRYMNTLFVGSGQNRQLVIPAKEIAKACEDGVVALYELGDNIVKYFGGNKEMTDIAVAAWKEGVTLQQKWYAYKYEGKTAEEYAEKIRKIEPEYEMPKKAGCISFADKR